MKYPVLSFPSILSDNLYVLSAYWLSFSLLPLRDDVTPKKIGVGVGAIGVIGIFST